MANNTKSNPKNREAQPSAEQLAAEGKRMPRKPSSAPKSRGKKVEPIDALLSAPVQKPKKPSAPPKAPKTAKAPAAAKTPKASDGF